MAGNSPQGSPCCLVYDGMCSPVCCRQPLPMNRPPPYSSATVAEKIKRTDTSVTSLEHTASTTCELGTHVHDTTLMHCTLSTCHWYCTHWLPSVALTGWVPSVRYVLYTCKLRRLKRVRWQLWSRDGKWRGWRSIALLYDCMKGHSFRIRGSDAVLTEMKRRSSTK